MSMESIGEEPGSVGEEEIASAQQLGRQVALKFPTPADAIAGRCGSRDGTT